MYIRTASTLEPIGNKFVLSGWLPVGRPQLLKPTPRGGMVLFPLLTLLVLPLRCPYCSILTQRRAVCV
jgi:hypothetical protein